MLGADPKCLIPEKLFETDVSDVCKKTVEEESETKAEKEVDNTTLKTEEEIEENDEEDNEIKVDVSDVTLAEKYSKLSRKQLVDMCVERSLDVTGKKADLAARVASFENERSNE
jgi:hypothetical protein